MKFKLSLAPLHGISGFTYRNAFFRHFMGFDYAIAPFIMAVKTLNVRKTHIKDLLPENNKNIKVIPQILSNNSDDFTALSDILNEYGYDEVNLNLGCPYPMVANKQRGSGLLIFPDKIDNLLSEIFSKTKTKVSIKIRLGRYEPEEIYKLIDIINNHPLSKIYIHPRTGIQMYKGKVYLEIFEDIYHKFKHEVSYNGDIVNYETFIKLSTKFPTIKDWMIGRAALSNPFLPETIKTENLPINNKKGKIKDFHSDLLESYTKILFGEKHILDKMKEIWGFLTRSFSDGDKYFKKLCKVKTLNEYNIILNTLFKDEDWIS